MNKKMMMYVINSKYEILYMNEEFRLTYKNVECGDNCFKALGRDVSICDSCPVLRDTKENIFYNSQIGEWVKASAAKIEWLGDKNCYAIMFRSWRSKKEEIPDFLNTEKIAELAVKFEQNRVQEESLRHQALIQALSSDFSNVFYIDVCKNTFEVYRYGANMPFDIRKIVSGTNDFEKAYREYVNMYVHTDDKINMLKLLDEKSVMARFELKDNFVQNYRVVRDGRIKYHQIKCVHVDGKENGCKMILGFRDVDEDVRKDMEHQEILSNALNRAEDANRAKSTFLFNMSHDIRTPMNAIIGFTHIAQKNINDTEKVKDCLVKVEHAGEHLLRLINDILGMANIENGNVEIKPEPCNIISAVKETEDIIKRDMYKKDIDFSVIFENITNENVICDVTRIRQIEINLLSNALKYTNRGGKVTYRVIQTGYDNGYASFELRIKDNGIGIDKDFQKHIFGAFERERSATESGVAGTGLGLAITKKLVDLHKGTIEVISEKGKGSEFIVRFKFKATDCVNNTKTIDNIADRVSFEGKRVLVAEDNELNREIAEAILKEQGFDVEIVNDGVQAVETVSKSVPGYYDIVLMDIQMPRMDGYQATTAIRALDDRKLAGIPIVAMTANAFEEDRTRALSTGMNEHISKPIDINKMVTIMQNLGI